MPSFSDRLAEINVPLAREAHTLARIGEVARLVQSLYLNCADPHSDDARSLMTAIFEMIPSRRGRAEALRCTLSRRRRKRKLSRGGK